jgi:hypothetical protein
MIAEKEVVLTFLLQLLSERRILDRLAFKGGTCLRKMFVGSGSSQKIDDQRLLPNLALKIADARLGRFRMLPLAPFRPPDPPEAGRALLAVGVAPAIQ